MTLKTGVMMLKIQIDHRHQLQLNRYSHRNQLFEIIKQIHNFYCIFYQINAAWVSRRDVLSKKQKKLIIANSWPVQADVIIMQ